MITVTSHLNITATFGCCLCQDILPNDCRRRKKLLHSSYVNRKSKVNKLRKLYWYKKFYMPLFTTNVKQNFTFAFLPLTKATIAYCSCTLFTALYPSYKAHSDTILNSATIIILHLALLVVTIENLIRSQSYKLVTSTSYASSSIVFWKLT